MEDERDHEPLISLVEILIIAPYILVIDIIGILLAFLALDDFFILDILMLPVLGYLWFKGVPLTRYVSSAIGEAIPWIGDLPLYSVGFILTIVADRNPKVGAALGAATGSTALAKGAGGVAKGVQAEKGAVAKAKDSLPKRSPATQQATGLEADRPLRGLKDTMEKVPESNVVDLRGEEEDDEYGMVA
ncbi:MAG: hypothetical protein G01um101420_8 [Parcubacteria group bacterium Gr01-1014_20]|nr:MAG: hypothetical protein G01um101420_8 [Parcubacteria group bacterium Gr01-1014_20]